MKILERWKEEMPTEGEMRPKDKYTMFDRKEKGYRKGIHSQSLPFPFSPRFVLFFFFGFWFLGELSGFVVRCCCCMMS